MWQRIYGVYDRRANSLLGPLMHFANQAVMVRQMMDAVNGQGSILAAHSRDFVIREFGRLGSDDPDAPIVLEATVPPVDVIEVVELVTAAQPSQGDVGPARSAAPHSLSLEA